MIVNQSTLLLVPTIPRPKNQVPKGRAHPEAGLLAPEVMLVVVSLQELEEAHRFGDVYVMQGVVADVVAGVSQLEETPEEDCVQLVVELDQPPHCKVADCEEDAVEGRRKHESVSEWGRIYGSSGSMWCIPWAKKCRKRASCLLGMCLSEWKMKRCTVYSTRLKKRSPARA